MILMLMIDLLHFHLLTARINQTFYRQVINGFFLILSRISIVFSLYLAYEKCNNRKVNCTQIVGFLFVDKLTLIASIEKVIFLLPFFHNRNRRRRRHIQILV